MICEYLEPNKKNIENRLVLDYLKIPLFEKNSKDNTINGKIVDFGQLEENIPEFADKKLRKMSRIICNCLQYKEASDSVKFVYKMSKANLNILKTYVNKNSFEIYLKALEIINRQISMPDSFILDMLNIKNTEKEFFYVEKKLNYNELIKTTISEIEDIAKEYKLKVATQTDPIEGINPLGNMILELPPKVTCIYLYDKQKEITKIIITKEVLDKKIKLYEWEKPTKIQ